MQYLGLERHARGPQTFRKTQQDCALECAVIVKTRFFWIMPSLAYVPEIDLSIDGLWAIEFLVWMQILQTFAALEVKNSVPAFSGK